MKYLVIVFSLLASTLVLACPQDKICIGDYVTWFLYEGSIKPMRGIVHDIADKNVTVFVYNSCQPNSLMNRHNLDVSQLSKFSAQACQNGICAGDKVFSNVREYTYARQQATVLGFYNNGYVDIQLDRPETCEEPRAVNPMFIFPTE